MDLDMVRFIDFHTHLHLYSEIDEVLKSIKKNKILMVANSNDLDSYYDTCEIAQKNPLIIPTFGVHPQSASKYAGRTGVLKLALQKTPIIGEIGLDYYWVKDVAKEAQKEVFEYIIREAVEQGKYCIIHTKGAEKEVYKILKEYGANKVIIHWYSGPLDIYKKMIAEGYYFTFGCEVKYSKKIQELLNLIPTTQLLTETDNPVGEEWLGGNTHEPDLIIRVMQDISDALNKELEEVEKMIFNNSRKILQKAGVLD